MTDTLVDIVWVRQTPHAGPEYWHAKVGRFTVASVVYSGMTRGVPPYKVNIVLPGLKPKADRFDSDEAAKVQAEATIQRWFKLALDTKAPSNG